MCSQTVLRRRALPVLAAVLACLVLWPSVSIAQTPPLAEIARKEQERRKGIKNPQKVITSKDLRKIPPPAVPAPGAAGAGSGEATPDVAGAQDAQPAQENAPASKDAQPAPAAAQQDEAAWRARMAEAQETLRRNELFLQAVQTRINSLTTDFVNRDDPYQRQQIGEDRTRALAELERLKLEVEANKKQISDIEDEARKAGVPPGWLR